MKTAEERAAWLAERANYVTASDVAAVLGLSPYKARRQVMKAKVYNEPGPDIDGLPMVMAGKYLESGVLAWHLQHRGFTGMGWDDYAAEVVSNMVEGRPVPVYAERITESGLVTHATSDVLAATPDAIVVTPYSGKTWATEIKNVGADKHKTDWAKTWRMQSWTNIPDNTVTHAMKWQGIDRDALRAPVYYWTQLQAQMSCLEIPQGRVVVAFGGNARADLDYTLDTDFERYMIQELDRFWAEVKAAKELHEP